MGGWVGGRARVNVNAMLGVGGDVGYGGCEPRIEGRGVGRGVRCGVGLVGGVRVDVNAMFGVGVIWGMGDVNQEYNVQKGIVQY